VAKFPEPKPDIAICSECGWRGPVTECGKDTDGDWETGYYPIDLCPKCGDGGCVDDYDMSPERLAEWEKWKKAFEKKKDPREKDPTEIRPEKVEKK
jgi:hypothetical protein